MISNKIPKGQSLLEVIVALAVVLLVILALVAAVTNSVRSTDLAKRKSQAASYAQEGMENMRAYRDAGWGPFWIDADDGANHGFAGGATTPSGSCPTPPSEPNLASFFYRCAKLERADSTPGKETVKVTLTVSWTDAQGTHKSELVSQFSKWQ